ncbi:MAG: hypothetical protein HYU86_00740 [Chloroflexi bacterium]|nr:hypothetical protein [Chloroflexota bacterium]
MAFYRVYGKWYHLEYSGYFERVVRARSPREAIFKFARCLSDVEPSAEIEWVTNKPSVVKLGQLEPQPELWVGDGHIYQIRTVTKVEPGEIECPTCKGVGRIQSYIEVTPGGY